MAAPLWYLCPAFREWRILCWPDCEYYPAFCAATAAACRYRPGELSLSWTSLARFPRSAAHPATRDARFPPTQYRYDEYSLDRAGELRRDHGRRAATALAERYVVYRHVWQTQRADQERST